MKKRISLIVETEAENHWIEHHFIRWIKENFQNYEDVKIKIEEVTQ